MKSIIAVFSFLFVGLMAVNAQIANGDFENWSDSILYETPTDWNSSNQQQYYYENTVFKSTDAQQGNYAAKIGVAEMFSDSVGGYVLHGSLNPLVGIPYTDNFEAVAVNYKIDLQPNDSLYLVVVRKNNGNIVDYHLKPFAFGPATSWTAQLIPVGNTVQDELLIGFIIGDPNTTHNPHPDSWALVDNIKLINGGLYQSDLPNHNFENWEEGTVEIADEWETISPYLERFTANNVIKTSDAFEGNYAIELSTILLGSDNVAGVLSKGKIDISSGISFDAVPISSTPVSIAGAYKYTTTSVDEGVLQIQFFNNGSLIGYHEENFTPQSSYSIFNSSIAIAGVPDSMIFIIISGDNPGSVLTLDAFDFDSDLSIDNNSIVDFSIFPNPATTSINVDLSDPTFKKGRLMTTSGQIVWETTSIEEMQKIKVSHLDKGTYILSVTNEKGSSLKNVIIQ